MLYWRIERNNLIWKWHGIWAYNVVYRFTFLVPNSESGRDSRAFPRDYYEVLSLTSPSVGQHEDCREKMRCSANGLGFRVQGFPRLIVSSWSSSCKEDFRILEGERRPLPGCR